MTSAFYFNLLLQLLTSTFYFLVRYSLLLIHFPSSLDFGRTMFRRNEGLENTGIGNWAKQQWTRAKSELNPLVRRRAYMEFKSTKVPPNWRDGAKGAT